MGKSKRNCNWRATPMKKLQANINYTESSSQFADDIVHYMNCLQDAEARLSYLMEMDWDEQASQVVMHEIKQPLYDHLAHMTKSLSQQKRPITLAWIIQAVAAAHDDYEYGIERYQELRKRR